MARAANFPAFITARYQPGQDGFPAFERAAEGSLRRVERNVDSMIGKLSSSFNISGKFEVDPSSLRQATLAAQQDANAKRLIAEAAERAAAKEAIHSEVMRLAAQQARAAAIAAEVYATALQQQEVVAERLGAELGVLAGTMGRQVAIAHAFDNSLGQQRASALSLGQQFSDLSVQILSGQNAAVAFAQQAGQAGFALSGFNGRLGAIGKFLTGGWGIALTVGASALGILAPKLLETEDALDKVKFAADGLGAAQSLLGQAVDLATGKIKAQRDELVSLAIAQAKVAELQAQARAASAREQIAGLAGRRVQAGSSFGGGIDLSYTADPQLQRLSARVLAANGSEVTAADRQRVIQGAIDELEAIQLQGRLTKTEFAQAASAVASLGVELENIKINQSVERLLKGQATAADRSLLLKPSKPKSTASRDEFGRDAADRLANLGSQFADAPTQAERVRKALIEVDDLVDDIRRKKPLNMDSLLQQAEQVRVAIETGIARPFADYVRAQREAEQIQALRLAGLDVEAGALQDILALERQQGTLSDKERAYVLESSQAFEERQRQIEQLNRTMQIYLGIVSDAQSAFERLAQRTVSLKNPLKAVGGFATDLVNSYVQTSIRTFSDKLFKDVENNLRDSLSPQKLLDKASTNAADSLDGLSQAVIAATTAFRGTAGGATAAELGSFGGVASPANLPLTTSAEDFARDMRDVAVNALQDAQDTLGITSANDNNGDVIIDGQKKQVAELRKQTKALTKFAPGLASSFNKIGTDLGEKIFGPLTKQNGALGKAARSLQTASTHLGDIVQGGTYGSIIGGTFGRRGAAIGGGLAAGATALFGTAATSGLGPLAAASAANQAIGKILGFKGGPLGVLTGLVTSTKKGSATLGFNGTNGSTLGIAGTAGNSSSRIQGSVQGANAIISSLTNIAQQLGGSLSGSISTSIGIRKDNYRVDTTGQGRTKGDGVLNFGKDQQAAIQAAIIDALRDGVIKGLRAGTQKLLTSSDDLETGLTKASKFQGVFDTLKQTLDPVGYAIEQLDRQFADLKGVFKDAGATAEEYADLEKLYSLQRAAAIKQAAQSMRSSLQGLLDDFNIGQSGGLSIQDRLNNALAAYNPLAAQVQSGAPGVDYQAFTDAARTVQDLARQLYGSQEGYFSIIDNITAITKKALADQQAVIDIATGAQTPFDASTPTPGSSSPSNDNVPIVQGLSAVEQAIATASGLTGAKLDALIAAIRAIPAFVGAAPINNAAARSRGGF